MMNTMEKRPVYLRVRDELADKIVSGIWQANEKLPAERQLSEQFSITRVTARQALVQLEAEGLIFRSNRRGWFVTPQRINYDPSRDIGFVSYVEEQGFSARTETLSKTLVEVPDWVADAGGIARGTPVYEILRRRYINERPCLIEKIYLNPKNCPGLLQHSLNQSLWHLLRTEYQLDPAERDLEIYPQTLDAPVAEALGVNTGSTGLYIRRVCRDQNGEFLEIDEEFWLHNAMKVVVQVSSKSL
ncbi:UTRA domain-containing protein [Oceanospirillum beijerinckii]|uniref:UTRA domain-containing protein n=1 Tax=Oceanospirillum beijerinckii TaxID=64976 RepID=UPI00042A3CA1|nr:UTRA domain-containing protein [Oceanospirillum beijerinckii]